MKKAPLKMQHSIESMEPRLLFSAGLEGMLAIDALPATLAAASHEVTQFVTADVPVTSDIQQDSDISQELVFVDTGTPDYQQLVDDLLGNQDASRRIGVVLLDASRDGISQITDMLGKFANLDAVHIISHGSDASINLGNSTLNSSTLESSAELISSWSKSFSDSGDLLIYGCNLAATASGQALVDTLATLTGTDVAASVDLTGSSRLGGDWELEYATGSIESTVALSTAAQTSFDGLLVTETVREEFNADTYNNNDGTANWSGEWAESGEATDPASGTIQIVSGQLQISTETLGVAILREVDLSGATWATLTLDRDNQLTGSSRVAVEISSDGGNSWTSLFEYRKTIGAGTGTDSYDISTHIAANTQLRFVVTKAIQFSGIYIDNIEISYGNSLDPIINSSGIPVSYTENDPATVIDNSLSVVDSDSSDFDGGVLTVDFNGTGTINDRLAIENQGFQPGQVGITGNQLYYSNTLIGSFTGGTDGSLPLSVTFNANASLQAVQAVMRSITYENVSDNPVPTERTVRFAVTDGDGGISNTSTTMINVAPVNDEPGGTDSTVTTPEDTAYTFLTADFGFTDQLDSNSFLGIRITALPAIGSLSNNGVAVSAGDYISTADISAGLLVYLPPADANGTGIASISFQVRDDGGTANGGDDDDDSANTITVNITPAPDAVSDSLTTSEDNPVSLNVLANDTFGSGASVSAVTQGTHGTVSFLANGSVTYTPAADFNGTDSFSYSVTSAAGDTESASVTVSVSPVNDAAIINGDTAGSIQEDVNVAGNYISATGLLTVTDADANESGIIPGTQTGRFGSFTIDSSGYWTYQAANDLPAIQAIGAGQSETDVFAVHSIDGTVQSIAITIYGTDDKAIVSGVTSGEVARGVAGQLATTSGQISISDVDANDTPSFADTAATPGDNALGMFALQNGSWTYTLDQSMVQHLSAGNTASDSITFTASDGTSQLITISITSNITNIIDNLPAMGNDHGTPAGTTRAGSNVAVSTDIVETGFPAPLDDTIDKLEIRQPEFEHQQSPVRTLTEIQTGLSAQHLKYTVFTTEYHYGDPDTAKTETTLIRRGLQGIEQLADKASDFSAEILQLYDLMKINISESSAHSSNLVARTLPGIMLTLSAGVVTWTVRSGGLLATLLSSIPVWKGFDPLPIIEATRKQREDLESSPEDMLYNEQVDGIFDNTIASTTTDSADKTRQ